MFYKTLTTKLYFRIWLALVLTITVVTVLYGWVNWATHQPLPREITIRNSEGTIIAHGFVSPRNISQTQSNDKVGDLSSQKSDPTNIINGQYGPGTEFLVQTTEGSWLHIFLPHRVPHSFWNRRKYGWLWLFIIVAVSVSFATYPIIRRLTRRLENLKHSVALWGEGQLSTRIPVEGRDEIAYLAQQFNQSADQIQSLVNSHKSLLANASHELRTPLARIRMALELLGDGAPDHLKNEMARSVLELDQLIDEILTASRLDAPQSNLGELELIDLSGLAAEECSQFNVELDLGTDPQSYMTRGNPVLIRRAIRNLIDNALHHSDYSSLNYQIPLVQITSEEVTKQSFIKISVLDRGPGVPIDEQVKIFEPFYRTKRTLAHKSQQVEFNSKNSTSSGAGLGLSLVKTICERHGGSVHYAERDGGGSSFVIRLLKSEE